MAAHRFWRLYINGNGGHTSVGIGELIFATSNGGAQAATGGTASASSFQAGYEQARAFDGTTADDNLWRCGLGLYSDGKGREWIQYDMGVGNTLDVVEMRIYFPGGYTATGYPSWFTLLYSDNGSTWTVQRSWAAEIFTQPGTNTYASMTPPTTVNREMLVKTFRYNAATNAGIAQAYKTFRGPVHLFDDIYPTKTTPYSGTYYIAGSTTVLGNPSARRVNLVDQKSGLLVRTVYTKPDGVFAFNDIGLGPWTLVGVDITASQNSVIYAHIPAAPMP